MAAVPEQVKPRDVEIADVDLKKSYVTGGGGFFSLSRSLPAAPDDLFQVLGLKTAETMMTDPDVSAGVLLLKTLTLADGLQIAPCVAKPEHDGYEQAKEVSDFVNRSVDAMRTPKEGVLEEMLDAIVYGNKIAEVTYRDGTGVDKAKLVLDSIKPKPYNVISFVVDLFWNLLGFLPTWSITKDSRQVLPREKFFVFTLNMKNCDPRGRSWLIAAWRAWDFKTRVWPIYYKWLHRFAVPSIFGTTAPGQKSETKQNPDGSTVSLTPQQVMTAALEEFENGSVVVGPDGSHITPLEATGKGEQFEKGFAIAGKQITLALLKQELATRDAQHQTKGSTGNQMSLLDAQVAQLKGGLVAAFVDDVIKPLVRINFGDSALEYLPKVSLGDSERRNWATDAEAFVALATATRIDEDGNTVPVLTYSQVQTLAELLSIPAPSDDEVKAMREHKKQANAEKQKQQEQGQQSGQQQSNQQQEKKAA